MKAFHIYGGVPLQGKVRIQGSKNAALPVLAATLLTGEDCTIRNCPQITDVEHMICLLKNLGCRVRHVSDGYRIDSACAKPHDMSGEAITGMRSSLCMLGAMLARFHEVRMEHPGGCVIGERPIDLHLKALAEMGVTFSQEERVLVGRTNGLHGAQIALAFPSVGATENILLAAVLADGETCIQNAAREPEIEALCCFLASCGAQIEGVGTDRLRIQGCKTLHGAVFTVPVDRIVAGTYLFACTGCGGEVFLEQAPWEQMQTVIALAEQMGAVCQVCRDVRCAGCGFSETCAGLYVQGPDRPRAVGRVQTSVYPGFPTDMQSMALAVLARADGESVVQETIFENRFRVIEPLRKMGADVRLRSSSEAVVRGVPRLSGAQVEAGELRGGAALVLAGLMARGETVVTGCDYIGRGYENIGKDLKNLGARIVSGYFTKT